MPFTPFHLGIALLIGVIFYKYLDMISLLVGSIILDIWPFLVLFFGLPYHLHGFSHSLLIALVVSLILAFIRIKLDFIKFKRSFTSIFFSFVIGTFSHIILDTPLYSDIMPFWPASWNPFLGLITYSDAVLFSIACFIAALIIFLINRKRY